MSVVDELVTLLGLKTDPKAIREAGAFQAVIGGVTGAAVALGGALAAAAAAIQGFAMREAEGIAETKRFADQIDISYTRLQGLQYGAESLSGSVGELRGDLERLTKTMSSPIPGEYNQTLYMLGISARNASGKLKGADDLLLDIADKLQGMSKQRQLQFADRLGLSQTSLRLIQLGRKGIQQLTAEAAGLGLVLDRDTGDRALRFQTALAKLRATVHGLGTSITASLLPALESGVKWMVDWIAANKELISSGVQQIVEGVGKGFKLFADVVGLLWAQIQRLLGPFGAFTKNLDATQAIAVAVALALGSVVAVVASAAAPFVAITAAIAAAVLALEDLYTWMNGGESVIGGWVDSFKQAYPEISALIGSIIEIVGVLGGALDELLKGHIIALWKGAKLFFGGLLDLITGLLNAWEKFTGLLRSTPDFLGKIADFLAPGLNISANAVTSTTPAAVIANTQRGSTGSGVSVGQLNINGAGDPMAVGDAVARSLGLGATLQGVAPGMLGPQVG